MKFVRYVGVQVAAYAIDMGGFLVALYGLGVTPLPANVFGKLLAGAFAFFAHRSFTFRVVGQSNPAKQAVRYVALLAFNLPLSSVVLAGMLHLVPQPMPAKFLSDVICVAITYWLSKRFVFQRPDAAASTNRANPP